MIVLLTMPLGIYYFDTESTNINRLTLGLPEYGGLTWNGECIYLSHSNIDNASLKNEKDYRNANVGIVRAYSCDKIKTVSTGLSQPHQILSDSRGRLLIANTGLNRIDVVSLTDNITKSVYLNECTCDMIGDERIGDHFNGFFEYGDTLFVVAHNNGRKSNVWELDVESFEVKKIHETKAEWAHNCWVCEHGIVICDSKNGSIYDVITGETLWRADSPCITRGLAATDEYIFVGHSEFGDRLSRRYSKGGFWVIDRKSLQTIDKFLFPGTGCTIEVRLLDVHDYCHKAPLLNIEVLDFISEISITKIMLDRYKALNYKLFKR